MIYNNQTIFTLGNGLAAISATRNESRITATDGQGCQIHFFNTDGTLCERICSARSYRRLRPCAVAGGYTAISCCDSSDVFILDNCFNENARITLDSPCDCRRSGINGLADAQSVQGEGKSYFIGTFSQGAYLFDKNGSRLRCLCSAESGESLTDFISFAEESYAFATIRKSTQTLSVSVGGEISSVVIPRKYILRMLFFENSTVYGLFGRNYVYNHIIPIYTNGVLSAPK